MIMTNTCKYTECNNVPGTPEAKYCSHEHYLLQKKLDAIINAKIKHANTDYPICKLDGCDKPTTRVDYQYCSHKHYLRQLTNEAEARKPIPKPYYKRYPVTPEKQSEYNKRDYNVRGRDAYKQRQKDKGLEKFTLYNVEPELKVQFNDTKKELKLTASELITFLLFLYGQAKEAQQI